MNVFWKKNVDNVFHHGQFVPWTTVYTVEGNFFSDPSGSAFQDHNLEVEVCQILDSDIFSDVELDWSKYGYIWSSAKYHIYPPAKFTGKRLWMANHERINPGCSHHTGDCRESDFDIENFGTVFKLGGEQAVMEALQIAWVFIYRELTR